MVAFYLIERLGRRTLVLAGGIGCCIFNILIGSMGLLEQTSAVQSATLAIICMWVFTYACGFAGTGWTVAGEVATPRLRAKTTAFVAATNAISGAIYNSTVSVVEPVSRCDLTNRYH
jgi:SP family sugar:H+ symporter-like MFS transporter